MYEGAIYATLDKEYKSDVKYIYDDETGLYYLQSRYYNPKLGRFISADGVTSTGQGFSGNNTFAYCLNNPTNFADYNGEAAEELFAWWAGSMGWLCAVDGPAILGEIIYAGGLLILGALALTIAEEITSEQTAWDRLDNITEDKSSSATSGTAGQSVSTVKIFGRYAAKKPVNLPSWNKLTVDMEHIKTGHMPGGSRNPKGSKSVFYGLTAEEIYKAIKEAYNNASKLATVGDRVHIRGKSSSFGLLIDMWLNLRDFIIETAYPYSGGR